MTLNGVAGSGIQQQRRRVATGIRIGIVAIALSSSYCMVNARLADRSRVVAVRKEKSDAEVEMNKRAGHAFNRPKSPIFGNEEPIEGPRYRGRDRSAAIASVARKEEAKQFKNKSGQQNKNAGRGLRSNGNSNFLGDPKLMSKPNQSQVLDESSYWEDPIGSGGGLVGEMQDIQDMEPEAFGRHLSQQLTSCCATWVDYSANNLCSLYGQDCSAGQEPSHDSGDDDCSQDGLSFIGVSFSVNTASGNPYSYHLCDQFPMENIIDRNYDYVMSMDEDGWLVGGGYKSFDYSGKMPYIDSSHTELLRIGSLDPEYG
jgi:hypothetical protein